MPRHSKPIPIDAYILDVLMRDLVGHDQQPAAFLVYLHLSGRAIRARGKPVPASLRTIADDTGLSKSAVQSAMLTLRRRELIKTEAAHATATPLHEILRPWRSRKT